ncbi:MAG: FHA domain-containing protein [Deltaproteobacteria bacterium]|nr:FHA domain-containing protein [Deltaproteobacteria bacterium]
MPGRRTDRELEDERRATEEIGPGLLITGTTPGRVRFREYKVEVVEGPDAGLVTRAARGSIVIGSSSEADLVLTDATVSRAHLRLLPHADDVEIADLGSKNGVYVHGARVQRCRIKPGTELTVGRTVIRVSTEDHERPLPPSSRARFEHVLGKSRAMRELFAVLEVVARTRTPIIIEGERGVGKRRVAEAIHRASGASKMATLEAAEATEARLDQLLLTDGTAVILHLEELAPELVRRLTSRLDPGTDVLSARVVGTVRTEIDLLVRQGRFDRALAIAFSIARVRVPALRERADDFPLLVKELLEELGQPDVPLSPEDLGRLTAYDWPDNVRELRASLERVVTFKNAREPEEQVERDEPAGVGVDLPYKEAKSRMLLAFEREYVRGLLSRHQGNVSRAARAAGIDRVYLHRLIKKYELD